MSWKIRVLVVVVIDYTCFIKFALFLGVFPPKGFVIRAPRNSFGKSSPLFPTIEHTFSEIESPFFPKNNLLHFVLY